MVLHECESVGTAERKKTRTFRKAVPTAEEC